MRPKRPAAHATPSTEHVVAEPGGSAANAANAANGLVGGLAGGLAEALTRLAVSAPTGSLAQRLAGGLAIGEALQASLAPPSQASSLKACLARLQRVERRVDALATRCDARFEAVAARLDALPAAATADPLAVPPSADVARARGATGEADAQATTQPRGQARPRPDRTQTPRTARGQGTAGEQSAAAQARRQNATRDHQRPGPEPGAAADHRRQNRPDGRSPLQQPGAWGEAVAQAVNDLLAQTQKQKRGSRGENAAQRGAGLGSRQVGRQGKAGAQRAGTHDNPPAPRRTQANAADQLARALGTGLDQTLRRALDPRTQARNAVNVATAVPQAAVTGAVALAQQLGALGAWVAETAQPARRTNAQPPARHSSAQNTHRPAPSAQTDHAPAERQNAEPSARPTPRAPSRLLGGQAERAASSAQNSAQNRPQVAAPDHGNNQASAQHDDTDPLDALNRQLIDQAWLRGVDLR